MLTAASVNRFSETVFLTASVNKKWLSQLMLGINRDGCFLCLPQSCKKRPQLIHFVVAEGDGEMPSGVGLWKIPRDGSALASRIERLLDCNFKGFLQIISIHRASRRCSMLSSCSSKYNRIASYIYVFTPDFDKPDVVWIMKQSAIGVPGQSISVEADIHWQLSTEPGAMQVRGAHTWKQEEKANKTCMHMCGHITWRALA